MGDAKTATFKDLCPEDRAKIQKLLGELVSVKKEKELLEESVRVQSNNHRRELAKMKADNRNLMDRLRHYMSIVSQSGLGDGTAFSVGSDRPKSAGVVTQGTADSLRDFLSSKKVDTVSRGTLTEITMQSGRMAEVQTLTPTLPVSLPPLPPMPSSAGLIYPYALQPVAINPADQYGHELMVLKAQVAALSNAVPHSALVSTKAALLNKDERSRAGSPGSTRVSNVKLSSTSARALGALPSIDDLNKSLPTLSLTNSTHLTASTECEGRIPQEKSTLSTDSLNISTYTPYVPISCSILDAIQETLPNLNYISGLHHGPTAADPSIATEIDQESQFSLSTINGAKHLLSNIVQANTSISMQPSKPYDFSHSQNESTTERQKDPSKELLSLINRTHDFVTPPSQCSILPEDVPCTDHCQGPVSEGSALRATNKGSLRKIDTPQSGDKDVHDVVEPPGTSFTTPQIYRAVTQRTEGTPIKLEVVEPPSMLGSTPSPAIDHTSRSLTSSSMQPMVTLPGASGERKDHSTRSNSGSLATHLGDVIDLQKIGWSKPYTQGFIPNFNERRPFPSDFDPSPPLAQTQNRGIQPRQDIIVKSTVKGNTETRRSQQDSNLHGTQISDDTQTVVRFLNL